MRGNFVVLLVFLIAGPSHIPSEGRQSKVNIKNFKFKNENFC